MSSREKNISKKVNDKTFTNSSKSKILKYLVSIENENVIRHRRTFKNLSLLIQFHLKYDSSILIKKYSLFLSIKTVDLQNMNSRLSSIKTL